MLAELVTLLTMMAPAAVTRAAPGWLAAPRAIVGTQRPKERLVELMVSSPTSKYHLPDDCGLVARTPAGAADAVAFKFPLLSVTATLSALFQTVADIPPKTAIAPAP